MPLIASAMIVVNRGVDVECSWTEEGSFHAEEALASRKEAVKGEDWLEMGMRKNEGEEKPFSIVDPCCVVAAAATGGFQNLDS